KLLAYQYLQMLPQIANGTSSKLWVIPTEFTAALKSITSAFTPAGGAGSDGGVGTGGPASGGSDASASDAGGWDAGGTGTAGAAPAASDLDEGLKVDLPETSLQDPAEALRQARGEVDEASAEATQAGDASGRPFDESAAAGQRPEDDEGQTED